LVDAREAHILKNCVAIFGSFNSYESEAYEACSHSRMLAQTAPERIGKFDRRWPIPHLFLFLH